MPLSKDMQYRMQILQSHGKTLEEAEAIARAEHRALSEAKREFYRGIARQQRLRVQRETPHITPGYGLRSRVGKIEPTSPHRKPSKGLRELQRELANAGR